MDPCTVRMAEHNGPVLHLFGGPYLTVEGARQEIPEGAHRLVAFVALHHRRVGRQRAAGTLWPDVTDERASGNLRSALWRLRSVAPDVLAVDASSMRLGDHVAVDTHLFTSWSTRLLDGTWTDEDLVVTPLWLDGLDLLPGWFDGWALIEQERLRQRTLHAMEMLSRRLGERGRFADAVDAALLAVDADPLRESAQRALITVHLAEGNVAEARQAYCRYQRLVRRELGVEPSAAMRTLVASGRVPDTLARRTATG